MDKEYWKKLYQGKWEDGKRRAEKIINLIETWGFSVEGFGFLPDSTEYQKESPDEKGKPDWKIIIMQDRFILLETTGTVRSRGKNDVWLRNDKFEFAENHPEEECWAGHIIEESNIIRFMKIENKEKYSFEEREIRGAIERFRIIPENSLLLISPEQFKKYLQSL